MATRVTTWAKRIVAGECTTEKANAVSPHVRGYIERRQSLTRADCRLVGVAYNKRLLITGAHFGAIRQAQAELSQQYMVVVISLPSPRQKTSQPEVSRRGSPAGTC